ncbi:hypothetical protein HS125_14725 [bacterium]|nr:hypothetical protein [bacterium]
MRSYALKRDAVRRSLLHRDEQDAYLRALIHIMGDKDVQSPWALDREI